MCLSNERFGIKFDYQSKYLKKSTPVDKTHLGEKEVSTLCGESCAGLTERCNSIYFLRVEAGAGKG